MRNFFLSTWVLILVAACAPQRTDISSPSSSDAGLTTRAPVSRDPLLSLDQRLEQMRTQSQQSRWEVLVDAQSYDLLVQEVISTNDNRERYQRVLWAQRRLSEGAGTAVMHLLLMDLWKTAEDTHAEVFQDVAVSTLIYLYQITMLDGTKCGDPSAPQAHIDKIMLQYLPIWQFASSLEETRKLRLIEDAVHTEWRTASKRNYDSFLCRGGLEELGAAMRSGEQAKEIANQSGEVGRIFVVEPPRHFRPSFRKEEEWLASQEKLRGSLRNRLVELLRVAQ